MKKLLMAACLSALAVTQVYATDMSKSGKPLTAQQQKMKDCNAEARTQDLKGQPRKDFMKTCLSKDGAPAAAAAAPAADAKSDQKNKMKTCNADAKTQGLKGDARKTFMKSCLSGAAPAAAAEPAAAPAASTAAPTAAAAPAADKKASQKDKMKTCNADAKAQGLKGQPRKDFMSTCLKG
jgi:hypothetical protein